MSQSLNLKTANLCLNVSNQWLENLDKIAVEKDQSIEDLVRDIIAQYLSIDVKPIKIEELLQQNKQIEGRLLLLEEKDQQIDTLTNRLILLEKIVASLQMKKTIAGDSNWQDDDDIEDEPDEILTDFLL